MGRLIISTSLALIPAFLLVWYFYKSKRESESPRVIINTLLLGSVVPLPIILLILPYEAILKTINNPLYYGIFSALFTAAIPEEISKFAILVFYCVRRVKFSKEIDGIIFGAIASLGFAGFENIFYVLDGGIGTAIIRSVTSVPTHALMGAVMGYYLFIFYKSKSVLSLLFSIGIPIIFHTAYDFPLFIAEKIEGSGIFSLRYLLLDIVFFLILFGIYRFSITLIMNVKDRENRIESNQIFEEIIKDIKNKEPPPGA